MRKPHQPVDSVNTSGLSFDTKEEIQPTTIAVVETPVVVAVEAKQEIIADEIVVEKKVETKKASKKTVEDDDVVPLSSINKASESKES
jgi:hypothetical protein